jgi:preprotein translocase subunit SecY
MFNYIKNIYLEKTIRNRILFVIFILIITRILSIIPIPSISGENVAKFVSDSQFLGLLNIFSGGGLATLSIVMIGVQPYITASIITQLSTILFPRLKEIQQEEGEMGRRRFATWTRRLTLLFAPIQAFGLLTLFERQNIIENISASDMLLNILIITAGSMLMMWLGEVINEKGIGNGISLIIFSGIVATLPTALVNVYNDMSTDLIPMYAALFITFILILMAIITVTEGERRLDVTYAKQSRGYGSTGMTNTYIPMRLTQAGVMPIIFAITFLTFPQMLAQVLAGTGFAFGELISNTIAQALGNTTLYAVIYFLLVIMFTFFYTTVTFDPFKTAENLQKAGAFVPGHRPGDSTTDHMTKVLVRVTTVGAVFLGIVAILPIIISGVTGITAIAIGGTSLLIAVSVLIDMFKKIDAQMTMREY